MARGRFHAMVSADRISGSLFFLLGLAAAIGGVRLDLGTFDTEVRCSGFRARTIRLEATASGETRVDVRLDPLPRR